MLLLLKHEHQQGEKVCQLSTYLVALSTAACRLLVYVHDASRPPTCPALMDVLQAMGAVTDLQGRNGMPVDERTIVSTPDTPDHRCFGREGRCSSPPRLSAGNRVAVRTHAASTLTPPLSRDLPAPALGCIASIVAAAIRKADPNVRDMVYIDRIDFEPLYNRVFVNCSDEQVQYNLMCALFLAAKQHPLPDDLRQCFQQQVCMMIHPHGTHT